MFEDITIIGNTKACSMEDSIEVKVCWKLSAVPPPEWVKILEEDYYPPIFGFVGVQKQHLILAAPNNSKVKECRSAAEQNICRANRQYRDTLAADASRCT